MDVLQVTAHPLQLVKIKIDALRNVLILLAKTIALVAKIAQAARTQFTQGALTLSLATRRVRLAPDPAVQAQTDVLRNVLVFAA